MSNKKHILALTVVLLFFFLGFAFFSGKLTSVTGFSVEATRSLGEGITNLMKPSVEEPPVLEPETNEENTREIPIENNEPLIDSTPSEENNSQEIIPEEPEPISEENTRENKYIPEEIIPDTTTQEQRTIEERTIFTAIGTEGNLTFTGSQDIQRSFTINKNAVVTGATMNLSGRSYTNFPLVTELTPTGDYLLDVIVDSDYIYALEIDFGDPTQYVKIYHQHNFSLAGEIGVTTGNYIYSVYADDNYDHIYITEGYNGSDLLIYNKSDFSHITDLTEADSYVQSVYADSDYIYSAGFDNKVQVYNRTNFSLVTELTDSSDYLYEVYADSDYIYAVGDYNNFQIYNRTNFSLVTEPNEHTSDLWGVYADSDYIYSGGYDNMVQVYNRTNFSLVTELTEASSDIQAVYSDSDYIYSAGKDNRVQVYNRTNFSLVTELTEAANDIYSVFADSDYIYSAGYDDKVQIYNKTPTYPANPNVSMNNTLIWSHTGEFNETFSPNKTTDFAPIFNTALNNGNCDCVGCLINGDNCEINLTFHSDTMGILEYNSVNISSTPTFEVPSCGDTITKSTTLTGNMSTCSGGHGIIIGADNVVLDCAGFAIIGDGTTNKYGVSMYDRQNITVKNCYIDYFYHNVHNLRSNETQILNNTLLRAVHYGIAIQGPSDNHTISDNEIANSEMHGILFASGAIPNTNVMIKNNNIHDNLYYQIHVNGITLSDTNHTIYNNTISNSHLGGGGQGIFGYYTTDVNISHNIISNHSYGIRIYSTNGFESKNWTIYNNEITNNTYYGIYIETKSDGTIIYNNLFENNDVNAYSKSLNASWNTTYDCSKTSILGGSCIGGNYYDDYTGVDTDGDEIGETSYAISGSGNNLDYLPLVYINNPPIMTFVDINSTLGGNYTHEDLTCWANATDAEGSNLTYLGYWVKDSEILINESWSDLYDGEGTWDIATSVETDSENNVYLTGYADPAGTFDIVTIKYNSTGSRIANATYNNGGTEEVKAIAIDTQDNIIVGGFTSNGNNYVIVKYNSSLDYLWDTKIASDGVDPVIGVITDSQNNIYFTVDTDNGLGDSLFKLNSSGSQLWNTTFNFAGTEAPYGKVAVDSEDNIYVSGYNSSAGDYDIYLVKYNSSGDHQWNITYDSGDNEAVYDSAADSQNNVYLTGYVTFSVGGPAIKNFFLLKYNSSGDYQWNATYDMQDIATETASGIDVDIYDDIYITGEDYGVATDFVKFNSSGSQIWNKTYSGASFGEDIAVDSLGGIYVVGWPYDLQGSGNWDYFIVKFNGMFVITNQTQGVLANSTLDNSYTSSGENWTCRARAYDGLDFSVYNLSNNNITIGVNTPPTTNITVFNDSSSLKSVLFSSIGSDISTAFQISKNVNITSAILRILGYSYSGSYPSNVSIDIGNDDSTDFFYNETLNSISDGNGSYSDSFFEVKDLQDSDVSSLELFNNSLYAGTSGGDIYKSSSNGETWTRVKDTSETNVFDFVNFSNSLYAGTGNNGKIYKSIDNGETWNLVYGSTESQIKSFAVFDSVLYAGTGNNGKILKSSDGTTWQEVYDSDSTIIYSLITYNSKIYATGNGKIYSSSDGISWVEEWDDSSFEYYISNQSKNISLETLNLFEYNNTIYAGTGSNGYILETNGSGNWYITEHLIAVNLTSLEVLRGELYAGDNQGKVFKQTTSNSELNNYTSEYSVDNNTLLLCHFENSLTCEQGEVPHTSENISYTTGMFDQGVLLNNSVLWYNISENLNLSQGTIEFWIKPLFDWNDNEDRMFFDASNSSSQFKIKKSSNYSNLYNGNNSLYFGIENQSAQKFQSNYPIDSDTFAKDEWHHVLATWNYDSGLSLFLDGKKTNTIKTDMNSIFNAETIFSIGNNLNYTPDSLSQSTQPVNAIIDELRILNITTNLNNSWENISIINNKINSFVSFNDSLYAGTGDNGKIYKSRFFKYVLNQLINNCSCSGCSLQGEDCHVVLNISSNTSGNVTLDNIIIQQEIADITWAKNNNYTLIDLDSLFYDSDGHTLTFNVTGNNSIDYEINASNILILSPTIGWTGTEYFVITADDGYGGNVSSNNFTLQVVNANDYAPNLIKNIPDISWVKETSYTGLDLDSYFTDADGNELTFTASGVSNIAISIDPITNIVTLTPASGFVGTGIVTFTADDGAHTTDSNPVLLTVYTTTAPQPSSSGGGSSSGTDRKAFIISPDLINEQIFIGESIAKKISIKNIGGGTMTILLKPDKTIENLINLSRNEFIIYPKNEKELTVFVKIPDYFPPEVYTGQVIADLVESSPFGESKYTKTLDFVLDIRQRKALFDINLDLLKERIKPGKDITANITLFNVGTLKDIDVILRYGIKNMNNEVIKEVAESLSVNEQKAITRNLKTPNHINSGRYVFYGNVEYSNTSAVASEVFYIEEKGWNLMVLIISVLGILILTTGVFTVYKKREWIKDKYKVLTGSKERIADPKIIIGKETLKRLEVLISGLNQKNKVVKYKEFMRIMRRFFVIRFGFVPTITFRQLKQKFINKKLNGAKHLTLTYFDQINNLAYGGNELDLKEFHDLINLSIVIINESQEIYIDKMESVAQQAPAITNTQGRLALPLQKPKPTPMHEPVKKKLKKKFKTREEFVNHLIPEAKAFVTKVRRMGYNLHQIRYIFKKNGWKEGEINKLLK